MSFHLAPFGWSKINRSLIYVKTYFMWLQIYIYIYTVNVCNWLYICIYIYLYIYLSIYIDIDIIFPSNVVFFDVPPKVFPSELTGPMVTPREGSRLLPREGNSRTNSKRISSRPTSREAKVGVGRRGRWCTASWSKTSWWQLKYFLFSPLVGEDSHFY